ncbi:MAG: hypothetical protein HY301_20565 [Verrucomicrobia bacterium]|nr:hypothetical protein [Verrucomicrobiota bacterium]
MKYAAYLAILLVSLVARGANEPAPSPRVFVCGHSFHIYIAKLLPELVRAAGLEYRNAGQQMIGGSTTLQHWELPDDKNRAKAALRAGEVDVLTLSPHMLMPDPGIDNFTKLGLEKNPKLRIYIQESWPARDGAKDAKSFMNEQRDQTPLGPLRAAHAEWQHKVEAQARALNESAGRKAVFIVPICDAVFALRERVAAGKAPGIAHQTELFRDPLGHPTEAIAQLNAYCHFAAIYRRSPVGLPVPAALKGHAQAEELNRLLQQLAWEAVTAHPMSGVKAKSAAE